MTTALDCLLTTLVLASIAYFTAAFIINLPRYSATVSTTTLDELTTLLNQLPDRRMPVPVRAAAASKRLGSSTKVVPDITSAMLEECHQLLRGLPAKY